MHETPSTSQDQSVPTVEIRTGFLAGLRRSPQWSMIVRSAEGALMADGRFSTYDEALCAARAVCVEAAEHRSLRLAA